jgi:glycosyltransferase involved in cell wall biosynthesis
VHWICWFAGVRTILFTDANSGDSDARGWRKLLLQFRTRLMCWPVMRHIAISEFIRGRLQRVGIPPDRISCVYNGVDTTAFVRDAAARKNLRDRMEAGPETVVLIFTATLLGWKRPEIALQVAAELVRRGQAVQLWMAGVGHLQKQLVQQAAQLGVAGHVKWLGHIKDPQRWMSAADLLIHTAVGEAFGNVFMEAMSCGLPVVASRSGSAPELVSEAVGRTVTTGPGEVAGLADAVMELTERREELGSLPAMEHAKRFTIDASVAGTLAVYDSLLGSSAAFARK